MKTAEKMANLLYSRTNTCDPHTPESLYLGGTRMCDIPQLVDEFMAVWHIEYNRKMKRFWFLRPMIEWLFINERFVKFSEFQEVFKGSHTQGIQKERGGKSLDDLMIRHPIYRLAGIRSEVARQQFIMNYKEDDLKSYFAFMLRKNRLLYTIFHDWHRVAIHKKHRIHSWITGTPGSGKSELMKSMILQDIRQNLKKDCSIIVIDPNGDFTKEIAQFKENTERFMKDKLVYIDLDLFKGEYVPVINPFQIQESANRDREIDLQNQQIGKALVEISQSFGQPLTAQQLTVMQNCVSILLEMENTSLWDLHTLVSLDKNNSETAPLVEAGRNSNNPSVRNFFRTMWENVSSFKLSKEGILVKTTKLLGMKSFANLVSGESTVNLKDAIDSNKLVLFNLAIGNLGDEAPIYIGKIIVSLLQSISFQRAGIEKEYRKPVYLYIDEFQDYVSPSMIRILTQGRKYKMFLTVANQFVGQGMEGEEQDAVFGTTKIKIIGANSHKSLSALSKETDSEIELLKKLQVGEFMVKVGEAQPFILSSSIESLDNKNAMNDEQWRQIIKEQKAKYYRKKPIDDILQEMMRKERNQHETLINTPPTDTSVKQTPKRENPQDKGDFGEKFPEKSVTTNSNKNRNNGNTKNKT
jgi:hypothetical protein